MKSLHVLVLVCVTPLVLAAQPPAGPQPNPITTVFKTRTIGLQRNIAQAFDSIPEAKFGFSPTPAQLTIGYIAQHLVSDNTLFCNAMGDLKRTQAADETATADSVKAKWPKAKLVTLLKDSFTFCEAAMNQLDDAKLAESTSMTFGGQTRQVSRAQMTLGHALDIADHYSQLANYMRLIGMLPPSALPRPGRGGL